MKNAWNINLYFFTLSLSLHTLTVCATFYVVVNVVRETSNWINLAIVELSLDQYSNVFANFSLGFFLLLLYIRYGKTSSYCTDIAVVSIFFSSLKLNKFAFYSLHTFAWVLVLLLLRFAHSNEWNEKNANRVFFIRPQNFRRNCMQIFFPFPDKFSQRHLFYDSISETENAMIY